MSSPPHSPPSHNDETFSSSSSQSNRKQVDSIILQADSDVSNFSEKINELANVFRKDVMQHFFEIRQKIGEQHKEKIDLVQSEHNEALGGAHQELGRLEEKIAIRDHYLVKFKDLTFRMADQIAYVRRIEREKAQLRLILRKWSLYCKERKIKMRNMRLAEKHRTNTMQRKILSRWFAWTMRAKRNTNELAWESRTQAAVSRIRNDFNTHLAELTKELEETKQLLRIEQKDKVILQENLKKAMMRGVCAMNNKFLEIIKDANENARFVEPHQLDGEENMEPNIGAYAPQQQQGGYYAGAPQQGGQYNQQPQPQYQAPPAPHAQSNRSSAPQVHVFREPIPDKRKSTKRRQHPIPQRATTGSRSAR